MRLATPWKLGSLGLPAALLLAWCLQADDKTADKPPAALPAAAAAVPVGGSAPRDGAVGRRIPSIVLSNAAGEQIGLYDFRDAKHLVVSFISTSCPISNQYLPILNELQAKYRDQGVQFLAINPHAGDTPEKIAGHARDYQIGFPVLCDPQQVAADVFSAQRTCETFVLDPQRTVRYRGRIDDRYQYSAQRDEPTRHDLASALDELLAGKPVSIATTDVAGCKLTRIRRVAPQGEITWSGQVAAIVQAKCEGCHHANTAAPFALQTLADVTNWSEMIREVVQLRRMPPWHADPRYGDFHDERRLTQQELDTLVAWIDDGMPEGDKTQAPAPREYPDGWRIGTPDVVFEIPNEVTIPARGVVPYMYFETPTNFTEDMWLQAAE
ncbi:MAG: hypothetical protein EHM42_07765, partial [Planctomycetaceae bacterium]